MTVQRMPEQLLLPGFRLVPQTTYRLFFAIRPDEDDAACIARLARDLRDQHRLTGELIPPKRLHVTLASLRRDANRQRQQHIIAMAKEAASAVVMPPFEIAFERAMSFSRQSNDHPFVLLRGLGIAALVAFQQALDRAIEKIAPGCAATTRIPHMTLLYDHRCVAEQLIETVCLTAHEFVLVHSVVGETRHVLLGRWPLRRPPGRVANPRATKAANIPG